MTVQNKNGLICPMQTPKICIDGRAAVEFSPQGWIAQEVIDQLVSAQGEPEASELLEKKRAVLLSHPGQVFAGQIKRFDTKKRIGSSFLYWAWEKNFVETSGIGAFHRFRPVDRLEPHHAVPTITTVLPALRRFAFVRPPKGRNHFVVPSRSDSTKLQTHYRIAEEHISVVTPTIRRFVHYVDSFRPIRDGWILIVTDRAQPEKKLLKILEDRFPRLGKKVLNNKEAAGLNPAQWLKLLQNTSIFFYLNQKPFDWPFLFLEALQLRVPAIYTRKHPTLSELVPSSALELSQYLTELWDAEQLLKETDRLVDALDEKGVFQPLGMARGYQKVYDKFRTELKLED